jgi:hypothetical protein
MTSNIVAYLLKARIVESAEKAVAREWLCKHAKAQLSSRDRSHVYERNNRRTAGRCVFCAARAEAV